MKQLALFLMIVLFSSVSQALVFPEKEFKIFQFPQNMIPKIDGDPSDWNIVPEDYFYGTEIMTDVENGRNMPVDKKDCDVRVCVAWVKGLDKLYFLYEAYDNFWDYENEGLHNDMLEISVDGDMSGGEFIYLDYDKQIFCKNSHAQNYHICTPAVNKSPAMVWNCPPWLNKLPFFNSACSYNFRHGEKGRLIMECWITPFDLITYDNAQNSIKSILEENKIIGLSWLVADWDGPGERHGLPSLSHDVRQVHDASYLCAFRLMPLEKQYTKDFSAYYSFETIDKDKRIVAFKDLSTGTVEKWKWDFGDGKYSDKKNPVHQYDNPGGYIVKLQIESAGKKSDYTTLWEVIFK